MFGLTKDSKSAEREDFPMVPLLEDDPVKTEPLDMSMDKEIKVIFLTRPVWFFNSFCMAARALILFAVERAKNLGETHGGLFSNLEPEVPQKIF